MPVTRLKICGITTEEDARAAVDAGADYLGLVFAAGSPRRVDPSRLGWLDSLRESVELVGVFRDQSPEEVEDLALSLDLDFVQLHGAESGESWRRMPVRVVEAAVVEGGILPPPRLAGIAWARLLDGGAGSGVAFDWAAAATVARSERLFLAGGLDPTNVGRAIEQLRPFAVDVSSGVELSPGRKDPERIRAFAQVLREADDHAASL